MVEGFTNGHGYYIPHFAFDGTLRHPTAQEIETKLSKKTPEAAQPVKEDESEEKELVGLNEEDIEEKTSIKPDLKFGIDRILNGTTTNKGNYAKINITYRRIAK